MSKFLYELEPVTACNVDAKTTITAVEFDFSRYGKYKKRLNFDHPRPVHRAIDIAEKWLSQPATVEHFEAIKDDLMSENMETYKDFTTDGNILRGTLLGDCRYLEFIEVVDGVATLHCGS